MGSRLPALLVALLVTHWAARVPSQSTLPAQENALIIAARAIRQGAAQAPLRITLFSGDRFTISSTDVHEAATDIVRLAAGRQTHPPVQPDHILVLRVRQVIPDRNTHVRVTLSSGATIRMRTDDAYDARLTFLRTELRQAISEANAAAVPRDASVQFDAKGADFTAWVKDFRNRLMRAWTIPVADSLVRTHVGVSFNVRRDGTITGVTLAAPSGFEGLDKAAVYSVTASSPAAPLPSSYPDPQIVLTVTFYYNETPR